MSKRSLFAALIVAGLLGVAGARCGSAESGKSARTAQPVRPRLVVVISIDQFRADYLVRFRDLFLPARTKGRVGGFRYLMDEGAWYPDCRYEHHRTVTAVGHAILSSGAQPAVNGVIGNSWWDRATGKAVYCVSDPAVKVVGAPAETKEQPMSPANLLTTTFGDELKLATGGKSREVSVSLKDRAAILLAGHRPDTVIWYDPIGGRWISSSYYFPTGKLPAWVDAVNAKGLPEQLRAKPWEPSVPDSALERAWTLKGGSKRFSHVLKDSNFNAFTVSPEGNTFVFETAKQAVTSEALGQDETPDVLTINLASNDYVGHMYGPDSPEVLDITVRTDQQLSDFFNYLAKSVPGGLDNVTIAISADHGVVTIPELNAQKGVPASRSLVPNLRKAVQEALEKNIGPGDWIASLEGGDLYLKPALLEQYAGQGRGRIEQVAAEAIRTIPGIYFAVGRTAILSGQVPVSAVGRRITQGFYPNRCGDVIVVLSPQWLAGTLPIGAGTSHGQPWAYDTNVPLLMAGSGVRKGVFTAPVSPARLSPTLSFLLGCARASAADEPLLPGLAGVEP